MRILFLLAKKAVDQIKNAFLNQRGKIDSFFEETIILYIDKKVVNNNYCRKNRE